MIEIHGAYHREFTFPADIATSFNYYSDFERILRHLPHISIVKRYPDNQFRMLYNTLELGIYRVRIFCDLKAEAVAEEQLLRISPLEDNKAPIRASAGLYSLTGHGDYSSTSLFNQDGANTLIDYKLHLSFCLPVPLGMRLVPEPVVKTIATSITNWRIREIAEGFFERSIQAYTA